jgi:hypothetical protein
MNEFEVHDADIESADMAASAEDDASVFFSAREDLAALSNLTLDDVEPALKRLGPPPFARKGFPFLGLLATIYDHVAQRVQNETDSAEPVEDAEDDAASA